MPELHAVVVAVVVAVVGAGAAVDVGVWAAVFLN